MNPQNKQIGDTLKASFDCLLRNIALFLVGLYRTFGTQFLGGNCRFTPSCSQYAVDAFHKHSFLCALKMVLTRLSKCHPFGSFGYDPVPERNCNGPKK